jgi:hypothetical protein
LGAIQSLDALANVGEKTQLMLFFATGILFVHWLSIVVRLARELGGGLRWKPRDAFWSFVIPFISLWEPYQVVRDVTRALAPERLPDPRPRLEVDASTRGYREGRLVVPPRRVEVPGNLVALWWTAYLAARVSGLLFGIVLGAARTPGSGIDFETQSWFQMAICAVDLSSAALAMLVVRGVAARLAERFRRIRYNPVEVLREAGIEWGREGRPKFGAGRG